MAKMEYSLVRCDKERGMARVSYTITIAMMLRALCMSAGGWMTSHSKEGGYHIYHSKALSFTLGTSIQCGMLMDRVLAIMVHRGFMKVNSNMINVVEWASISGWMVHHTKVNGKMINSMAEAS